MGCTGHTPASIDGISMHDGSAVVLLLSSVDLCVGNWIGFFTCVVDIQFLLLMASVQHPDKANSTGSGI